jgi:hypothetical protein
MNKDLSGPTFCTTPIPNRRTAEAVRPGTPYRRVSASVLAATIIVSRLRQRW